MSRSLKILCFALLLAADVSAQQQQPLLPQRAPGWKKTASTLNNAGNVAGNAAAQVYPTQAEALKEYGFTASEATTYRHNGRDWQMVATRFDDPTEAYGMFTLLRQPELQTPGLPGLPGLGDAAAGDAKHALIVHGEILLDIPLDAWKNAHLAELKRLVAAIPVSESAAGTVPSVVQKLPETGLVEDSIRYLVGPVGYAQANLPLPAALIGFQRSPELASAEYSPAQEQSAGAKPQDAASPSGKALVLIVKYPTPQIAAEQAQLIRSYLETGDAQHKTPQERDADLQSPLAITTPQQQRVILKRSSPLVIVVYGCTLNQAQSLAEAVNYSATVTWDQVTRSHGKKDNVLALLVGIIVLIALLIAGYLVLLIFFGGAVVILQRFFPNWRILPAQQEAIIKLNLKD